MNKKGPTENRSQGLTEKRRPLKFAYGKLAPQKNVCKKLYFPSCQKQEIVYNSNQHYIL